VGRVSADGQFRWDGAQWVPIPRSTREPTPWTRPMQLAAAGLFVVEAGFAILTSALYINHDSMLRAIQARGLDNPPGADVETLVTAAIVYTWIVVIVIAAVEVVAALGSYMGWRWMFWAALVLLGVGAIGGIINLGTLANPSNSPIPGWAMAVDKVLSIASFGLFAWMLIGVIRLGPWAMKKLGT
jgi:hypothetical protein